MKTLPCSALIQQVGSTDAYTAMAAIQEATRRADPACLPSLIAATQSGDEWVAAEAVKSLGLLSGLLNEAGCEQRRTAVSALLPWLTQAPPGLPDLPFKGDPNTSSAKAAHAGAQMLEEWDAIRFEAARALGLIGDPRAVPVLMGGLNTGRESIETRTACAKALGAIGKADTDAAGSIREVLGAWLAAHPPTLPAADRDRSAAAQLRRAIRAVLSDLGGLYSGT